MACYLSQNTVKISIYILVIEYSEIKSREKNNKIFEIGKIQLRMLQLYYISNYACQRKEKSVGRKHWYVAYQRNLSEPD